MCIFPLNLTLQTFYFWKKKKIFLAWVVFVNQYQQTNQTPQDTPLATFPQLPSMWHERVSRQQKQYSVSPSIKCCMWKIIYCFLLSRRWMSNQVKLKMIAKLKSDTNWMDIRDVGKQSQAYVVFYSMLYSGDFSYIFAWIFWFIISGNVSVSWCLCISYT